MAKEWSNRRFLVYRKEELDRNKKAVPLAGFKTHDEAQKYVNTLDYPATIEFNGAGLSNIRRAKQDFEYVTDSGTELIFKWEKTEYRVYKKNGQDLKLGAVIPEGLMKYCNEKF